jgi:hypothetical protein
MDSVATLRTIGTIARSLEARGALRPKKVLDLFSLEHTEEAMSRYFMLTLGAILIGLSLAQVGDCQQVQRYQPRTSTVSPYLNLTRLNPGGLPNYYAFVRPQQQQQAYNNTEATLRRQQSLQLDRLDNRIDAPTTGLAPTGTASWYMNPGRTTGFLNTGRYYPQVNVGR